MKSSLAILVAGLGVVLAACGSPPAQAPASAGTQPATSAAGRELTVFAAASLTEPFQEMAGAFSSKNGGAKPVYNFGGSSQLRAQIEQGARADVFASANEPEMAVLRRAGLVAGSPRVFARNRLVIITPKANPGNVESLGDLSRAGVKLILAGPTVPVGAYALQMLDKMSADRSYGPGFKERVLKNVISQETDVKQVVAKIQLGEGDAGVVYASDVTARVSSEVRSLEVPDSFNVVALYPIAVIEDARQPALGQAFVEFVLSTEGQAVLKKHNFAGAM